MEKPASNDHPIHDLLKKRWSPRAFDPRPIPPEHIRSILEAARWAASSYNQQPWHFLVATNDDADAFATMVDCLVPGNQSWAKNAPLLILTVAKADFDNGKPNHHAAHDVGQAAAQLTAQATELGLFVHQMAGIEADKIRAAYNVPAGFAPLTAIAVGYAGDRGSLEEKMREMEIAPRTRRPFGEFVFDGAWGRSADL
jgi:nitroreductase